MKKIFFLLIIIITQNALHAQGVKIGGAGNPDEHAILELDGSSGKGLLLPRLTTVQMDAMIAPDGMIIYNTTDGSIYLRKSAAWVAVAANNNNGGFSLPHTSSHNLPGQYVLDLTNTGSGSSSGSIKGVEMSNGNGVAGYSENGNGLVGNSNTGTGGYFSSQTGAALITGSGNIGLGTITPDKARLQVSGTVGSVTALFENGNGGIAIENYHPGIGFNTYYNAGRKNIAAGYGGVMSLNPTNGDLAILSSGGSVNAGDINPVFTRMLFDKNGHIGVQGNVTPQSPFSFSDAIGNKISLWGNSASSTYGFGIQPSLLQMYSASQADDIAFGYGSSTAFTEHMRIKGNGKVGIGTTTPNYPLTVVADGDGFVQKGNAVEIGTTTSALGGMLRTFTNHSLRFGAGTNSAQMILTTTGEVGVGTALPFARLHVNAGYANLLQLDNSNTLATGVSVKTNFKTGSYYTGAIGTNGISNSSARLSFYTGTAISSASLTEKMSILDNGNVGINTVAPTEKLEVIGKTKLTNTSGDKEALVIDGAIKVVGANKAAFKVSNPSNNSTYAITIDHPLTNNDPSAVLIVTPLQPTPNMFISYDVNTAKWMIRSSGYYASGLTTITYRHCQDEYCNTTQVGMTQTATIGGGADFNVLVIKTGF
jgi:hypothetical protein